MLAAYARANGGVVTITADANGQATEISIQERSTTPSWDTVGSQADGDFGYLNKTPLVMSIESGAGIIDAVSGKTTIVLGCWNPDMQNIMLDQTKAPSTSVFEENPGGYGLLDVDADLKGDAFWDAYNKPFLDSAVDRRDTFKLAAIPKIQSDVLRNGIPIGMFRK